MVKMLVIADDFTGALDTGVQFTKQGLRTKITTNRKFDFFALGEEIDILALDAETRHLEPFAAYEVIKEIVKRAVEAGVECIYKKTDSALRGNIGLELQALLDASDCTKVHFIPAFPKQNRTTVRGVHYVEGVPVAESVFGKDPFEPVEKSNVREIIAIQSDVNTYTAVDPLILTGEENGIIVYDAEHDEDIYNILKSLKSLKKEEAKLLAGCAGFASALPQYLDFREKSRKSPKLDEGLLVVCGSVNPISIKQVQNAKDNGFYYLSMTEEQRQDKEWATRADNSLKLQELGEICEAEDYIILDTNCLDNDDDDSKPHVLAKKLNLPLDVLRQNISESLGNITKKLIDGGLSKNIMIIGGDTLFSFMKQVNIDAIEPIREIYTGVVLSSFSYNGRDYNLISKSGGFGDEDVILKLCDAIENK